MQREFLLNILLLVFINLLIKPLFIFGIDLSVQNRVGSEYGLYFALLNLSYIFQILNDFGIQNFNNRHVSQHPQLLPKYFPNLLALKFILSGVYVVFCIVIAWIIGYRSAVFPLLLLLLINSVLIQMILFLRSSISGLGYYRTDSFLSALDKLLMLITCSIALWVAPFAQHFSILSFAGAQTLALAITLAVVFFVLRSKAPIQLKPSWASNWKAGKPQLLFLIRESMPYALVILLMFLYARLDAIFLERTLPDGKVHADVYAGAYRLLDACNMFGYLFASLLLPMFARQLKERQDVRQLASNAFKLIWAGSITISAAIFFGRDELITWMMPARASLYRAETLGILIWTFIPVSVTYIFSTLLTADRRLMQMNRFFLLAIALDIVLNLLLLPWIQARGAAIATLSTQTFIAVAMLWLCKSYYNFNMNWRQFARMVGFSASIIGSACFIFAFQEWHLIWKLLTVCVAGGIFAILFGMLPLRAYLKSR